MPRKTGKIKSHKTILIVVEGYTEEIYFSQMKSFERFQEITIIPKLAKHSSLMMILSTAIKESSSGVYDSIWCVFDRDKIEAEGISNEIKNKIKEAESIGIKFADSLPAFEIWFLLHYVVPKKYYASQDSLIKALEPHITGYEKKQEWLRKENLYAKLKPLLETAITNSKTLAERNKINSETNTAMCNVYRIFEELLEKRTF